MKLIQPIIRFALFWLLIFNFQRLLFTVHYFSRIVKESGGDYFALYSHAVRLDFSMIGYFALATLPFYLFYQLTLSAPKMNKFAFHILKGQQLILILLVALIHCGEINVYSEWNHKLTTRVFVHLLHPSEVFRTATGGNYFFFFFYLVVELLVSLFLFRRIYRLDWKPKFKSWKNALVSIVTFFVIGVFSFLAARGGWQPIPITINSSIFSKSPIINDVAVNSTYFFGNNLILYQKTDIDSYFSDVTKVAAKAYTDSLFDYPKEHNNFFLKTKRPNVVFLVLESWVADAISYSGLSEGTTPHFDSLIRQGYYFDHFYSGAGTSEIGNSSIFAGNPVLPEVAITLYPDKSRKIKTINQALKPYDYTSGYLFGGDLDYGNIGAFFIDHGFDKVEDEKVFPTDKPRGKLNVYDADLFDRFLVNINETKLPFMQCVFTGSTHSPYDIPEKWQGFWKGEEAGFMDGIHYSDQAIFDFLEKCKKEPWFDNTIFVLVADHGRTTISNNSPYKSPFFRIPLLFWGNPLRDEYKGKVNHTIGNYADIAATLLYQMGISSSEFTWSRDLMNPKTPQFTTFCGNYGFGYLDSLGEFFYYPANNLFQTNTFDKSLQAEKLADCKKYFLSQWEVFKAL